MPNNLDLLVARLAERLAAKNDAEDESESSEELKDEGDYLEIFQKQVAADRELLDLEQVREKHFWRKASLIGLFGLTTAWLLIVVALVCLSATSPTLAERREILLLREVYPKESLARFFPVWFKLSDTVLTAFITSTTVSVIGLFMVAAKWLFPSKDEPKEVEPKK